MLRMEIDAMELWRLALSPQDIWLCRTATPAADDGLRVNQGSPLALS